MTDWPRRLFLLPGMHGTAGLFRRFTDALPSSIQATPIAYPSDECLDYAELRAYVEDRLPRDEPYALLAESFSGPVGLDLAASAPPNLRVLVLAVTFASNPLPATLGAVGRLIGPWAFTMSSPRWLVRRLLLQPTSPDELLDEALADIRAAQPRVLATRLQSILARRTTPKDGDIQVPVLCLAASRDRVLGQRGVDSIRERVPHAEVVEIDGPHMLLQGRPADAAAAVTEFLDAEWH